MIQGRRTSEEAWMCMAAAAACSAFGDSRAYENLSEAFMYFGNADGPAEGRHDQRWAAARAQVPARRRALLCLSLPALASPGMRVAAPGGALPTQSYRSFCVPSLDQYATSALVCQQAPLIRGRPRPLPTTAWPSRATGTQPAPGLWLCRRQQLYRQLEQVEGGAVAAGFTVSPAEGPGRCGNRSSCVCGSRLQCSSAVRQLWHSRAR